MATPLIGAPSLSPRRQRAVLAALTSAGVSVAVMATFGAPLIPTVARTRHVDLETAQWLLTITLIVGAVATPLLGRLGDGPLARRVLLATLATTAFGCVVAAFAPSFSGLLVGRALQGVGYATLPLAYSLAREHTDGELRRRGIATLSVTVAAGGAIGFPATGLLAELFGPAEAFAFGAAMCLAATAAVFLTVPRPHRPRSARMPLDLVGAALLALALGLSLLAVSRGNAWGWSSASVGATLGAGATLFAAWICVELRRRAPLVDIRLLGAAGVVVANVGGFLMSFGMFGGLTLVNRFLQAPVSPGLALGPLATGLVLLPLAIGSVGIQPVARRLSRAYGHQRILGGGAVVVAVALLALGAAATHVGQFALGCLVLGAGVGCTFAVMPALILAHVSRERTGSLTSVNQVLRSSGGACGSAATVAVLQASALDGTPTRASYTLAFAACSAACALCAIVGFGTGSRRRRGSFTSFVKSRQDGGCS